MQPGFSEAEVGYFMTLYAARIVSIVPLRDFYLVVHLTSLHLRRMY